MIIDISENSENFKDQECKKTNKLELMFVVKCDKSEFVEMTPSAINFRMRGKKQ